MAAAATYNYRMRAISFCLGLLLAVSAAAADYEMKTVAVLPVEQYPARVDLQGVTIAVDPYATNEKCFKAFDIRDLVSRGYFPVHVIIKNSSDKYLTLRTRNVLLISGSGQELYTTPATLLVQDVFNAGLVSRVPSGKGGSPLLDFTGKELTNRPLEPGAVTDGFLFFFAKDAKKKNLFAGSKLLIPQLVSSEGPRVEVGPFSIPLDPAF
jgi:hypothetical protein